MSKLSIRRVRSLMEKFKDKRILYHVNLNERMIYPYTFKKTSYLDHGSHANEQHMYIPFFDRDHPTT